MTSPASAADVSDCASSRRHSNDASPSEASSLHRRRFDAKPGDLPERLTVSARRSESNAVPRDSPSPARLTPEELEWIGSEGDYTPSADPEALCDAMLRRLEGHDDPLSARSREVALETRATVEALDHLEKLYELMNRLLKLKEHNERALRRAREATFYTNLLEVHQQIELEMERARKEGEELKLHNDALNADLDAEYGYTEALLESMLAAGRGASMKRAGSRWKAQKFRGSLLRKQRSRSVGGEESEGGGGGEARLSVPYASKTRSEECRKVDKSKVSKWTKVKSAFKWEKAHTSVAGGAAGMVGAAGALAGAVAMAGSSPGTPVTPAPPPTPAHEEPRDSVSVTPGSLLSLTPNSSCEELRLDSGSSRKSGGIRCDENDNTFLQAPTLDDSSTSPSPNKLHKTPWSKMRDIIQTRKESVRRKQRSTRSAGVTLSSRRRSFSDGGESDAPPPVLTLTIPSSEELDPEGEPSPHLALRKQRSLELGCSSGRPPAGRRSDSARTSKWSKVKKAFLTSASASVPSSPNRHSAFFTDIDTEAQSSGCEASGVRDEIQRDYAALQSRLRREFSDKRDKLYAGMRPVATEDQLSPDFRKKLAEWQRMKGVGAGAGAGCTRQPPPVPDRSDLSEDFLKKWDEWKRLKETNSVPAWAEEARPDEVLVQTSTGFFRFQGISRSFTRKLHEWEKARGIAPEASTSALLRAAQGAQTRAPARGSLPPTPLARTQSAGSVAPSSSTQSVHALHASSLSVNDADKLEISYDRDNQSEGLGGDDIGEDGSANEGEGRGAVLVEVEAEEVCTAAPLMAVSPQHTPQKPVYTYDHEEPARLLCETSTAAALVQQETITTKDPDVVATADGKKSKSKGHLASGSQIRGNKTEKSKEKRPIMRQPSIEDDAQFIRRTIEEIERGSTNRVDIQEEDSCSNWNRDRENDRLPSSRREDIESSISTSQRVQENFQTRKDEDEYSRKAHVAKSRKGDDRNKECESDELSRRKELEKGVNGKKKMKARARLEREHSKPSESDTEPEMDTVTVEIPRRRKRPRRPSERPRTPPPSASAASDTEGEVYILKLRASEQRQGSPEIIVKTKRKIFSPVVRSGETTPRAVIPLDVEELAEVRPRGINFDDLIRKGNISEDSTESRARSGRENSRKSQDDLTETRSRLQVALEAAECGDDIRTRSRPPLPSSPSAQRRPPPKETAPSIRIMIQRYNMKINEDGHTSPASSGTSSPAWRSPAAERRRPPDMPHRVNIRTNPFFEREVQKSASACQLSRREATSSERRLEVPQESTGALEGVLKSRSACALHPVEWKRQLSASPTPLREEPEPETNVFPNASITSNSQTSLDMAASASNSRSINFEASTSETNRPSTERAPSIPKTTSNRPSIERLISTTSTGSVSRLSLERIMAGISRDKRPSLERMMSKAAAEPSTGSAASRDVTTPSERTQRIRAAREKFLSSPGPVRRDLSGSAGELRPTDRLSRASCGSELSNASSGGGEQAAGLQALARSASTGMVNVERDAWQRVCDGGERSTRRSRFSLARLAARLRRRQDDRDRDTSAVSRLCRQSLLVQLRPKH